MMKGFIHVVEVFIIVLTVFVIIMQFGFLPQIESDFTRTKQILQVNDILFSLEAKGINWFDKELVEAEFNSFLPNTSLISLKIRNVIKPHVDVGCYCNSTELGYLNSSLSSFTINDRLISFDITPLDPSQQPVFSLAHDVILLAPSVAADNPDPSLDSYVNSMLAYLRNDRGVVEIRNFPGIGNVSFAQRSVFGLDYDINAATNAEKLEFSRTLKISSPIGLRISSDEDFYNIYKNYYSIPVFNDSFNESDGAASRWNIQNGNWGIVNKEYVGSSPSGIGAATTKSLNESMIRASFNANSTSTSQNAYVIFSFSNLQNFHFAGANVSGNKWVIGQVSSGSIIETATFSETISPDADYKIVVINNGGNVTLFANGEQKLNHDFGAIAAGDIGLAVINTTSEFDDVRITLPEIHKLKNFLGTTEQIRQSDYPNEDRTILLQPFNRSAAVVVNHQIADGKGRAAWISDGDNSLEERKILIRDIVSWAAGDEMDIIKRNIVNPATTSFFKLINKDTFEIIEIVMSIGKIF